MHTTVTEQNKATVTRFNKECIELGNLQSFNELLDAACINHTAPEGAPNDAAGMVYFLNNVLRAGFPNLTVTILDQVAEGDKVATRKEIHAVHEGSFMGIAPTGKQVVIKVIDIVQLQNGKYIGHWGMSNLPDIIAELKS